MSKDSVINVNEKFLTETDKLVLKLDSIITAIRGKEGPIDYKAIKDGFDKMRFKVNEKLKEAETFMAKRDKILTSTLPNEIFERKKLESNIENLLDDIDKGMKELDDELTAQKKKKGKYGDFTNKEEIKKLMQQKYQILRSKLDGIDVKEEDIIKSDKQSQVSYLTTLCEKGILTVNEVRAQLGYSPVEGGDELKALYTDVQQNTVGNKDEKQDNSLYKNNENKENEELN